MEVVYAATNTGKFINRGFLNGPVCPIYGFGILFVVASLTPIKDNILGLFIGALIVTSALEFITGFILEKLFNDKWWDYSDMPFNLMGYVCLKFSIAWGFICVFIIKLIYPLTDKLILIFPKVPGIVMLSVILTVLTTDFIITLISVLKLPKRLKTMLEIEKALDNLSESLGNEIAENTVSIKEKQLELKETLNEKAERVEELKAKYFTLLNQRNFIHKRIWKAFPDIQNGKYRDIVLKIKKAAEKSIKEKKTNDNRRF